MYGYLKYLLIIGIISNSFAQSGLSVHGYLNQAFAISSGHQIFGIPEEGTTDYRNLALQFRYDINESNNIVIQFSHDRQGLSPIMQLEEDVELDWAFFEYRFDENTSLKVGKIQLPFGIYNEYRDVGTLLPFYRLPFSPYGEGNYMSETVDGISISHLHSLGSDWNATIELYGGQWRWTEWLYADNPFGGFPLQLIGQARIRNGLGLKLLFNTPMDGFNFGFGGQHAHVSEGISFGEQGWIGERNFFLLNIFIDYSLQDYFFRSEFTKVYLSQIDFNVDAGYVQTGVNLFENLAMNFQYEFFKANEFPDLYNSAPGLHTVNFEYNNDLAVGLNYMFSTNLILKLEMHWNKGFLIEDKPINLISKKNYPSKFSIISVSTSF